MHGLSVAKKTPDPVSRDPVSRDPVSPDPVSRDPVSRLPVPKVLVTFATPAGAHVRPDKRAHLARLPVRGHLCPSSHVPL